MDSLQDTASALETYATEVDGLNEDRPHAYIRIFGVLNGLVIQQDAAFLLFAALGAPKSVRDFATSGAWAFSIPGLADARRCRIAGAGHPIEWGERRGDPASTFIVQHSVSSRGCQFMVLHHDGEIEWHQVSLKTLVEAQQGALREQFVAAIAELGAADADHRMKYRSNQLMSIFAASDYWTPKVALAVHGSEPCELGLGGLQWVEDALRRFREALAERERPFAEPLLGLYRHADYSVRVLRAYFKSERTGSDQEIAEILAHYLDEVVGEVRRIAREIDEEYSASEP